MVDRRNQPDRAEVILRLSNTCCSPAQVLALVHDQQPGLKTQGVQQIVRAGLTKFLSDVLKGSKKVVS